MPDYIEVDHAKMTAKLARIPPLTDVPYPVQMEPHLVVEYLFALIVRSGDCNRGPPAARLSIFEIADAFISARVIADRGRTTSSTTDAGEAPVRPTRLAFTATPLSLSSCCNSPAWNISRTMSQPPTNSPFT